MVNLRKVWGVITPAAVSWTAVAKLTGGPSIGQAPNVPRWKQRSPECSSVLPLPAVSPLVAYTPAAVNGPPYRTPQSSCSNRNTTSFHAESGRHLNLIPCLTAQTPQG